MNYLAHSILAKPTTDSLVGNLLGDFCKGVDLGSLPKPVLAGLANHRAVDKFTDTDPAIREAKQLFSVARRRFAGVALDVLFDHYLIKHWPLFYAERFDTAKPKLYAQFAAAEPMMPSAMLHTMQRVRTQDWFAAYQQLEHVGLALDRIASRVRFANQFAGIVTEIRPHYHLLEQVFLTFYPRLQAHIKHLDLENRSGEKAVI